MGRKIRDQFSYQVKLATCQSQFKHNKQGLSTRLYYYLQECRIYEDSCRNQVRRQGRTGTGDVRTEWNGAETGGTIADQSYSLIGEVSTMAGIGDGPVSAAVIVHGGGSSSVGVFVYVCVVFCG